MLDLIIIIAVIVVVIYFIFLRRILRKLILLPVPILYSVLGLQNMRVSIVFHRNICTNLARGYEWWENKHNQSK